MLKLLKITQRLNAVSQPIISRNCINFQNLKYIPVRCIHDDDSDKSNKNAKIESPTAVTSKFEIFRDEDATVILDVEEERAKLDTIVETVESVHNPFKGLSLTRKLSW